MSGECDKCYEHALDCRCIKIPGMTKVNINKLHDAIHKMNENITIGERNAVNRYHYLLWTITDKLIDISRRPSMQKLPLARLSQELKDLINIFPVLEG